MKKINLYWHEAAKYEVCGKIEIETYGKILVLRTNDWMSLQNVWRKAEQMLSIKLPPPGWNSRLTSVTAEGFQEVRI